MSDFRYEAARSQGKKDLKNRLINEMAKDMQGFREALELNEISNETFTVIQHLIRKYMERLMR